MSIFRITEHALDRFTYRFPDSKYLLQEMMETAILMKTRTVHGQLQYRLVNGAIAVVKDDCRDTNDLVVTTVIYELQPNDLSQENLEIYQDHLESIRRWDEYQESTKTIPAPKNIDKLCDKVHPTDVEINIIYQYELQILSIMQKTIRMYIQQFSNTDRNMRLEMLAYVNRKAKEDDTEAKRILNKYKK